MSVSVWIKKTKCMVIVLNFGQTDRAIAFVFAIPHVSCEPVSVVLIVSIKSKVLKIAHHTNSA